ncbi:MAG: dienelactone hydrolase family protein [Proteobacteria bacterium]|nr:dienelactone hydrolase family protein [Pseudomonadota bacterium]
MLLGIAGCDSGTDTESQASRDHVDAMAREHANDTSDASDGARIAPRYAVISERLPYAEVNDQLVYGYFVFPSDMVEPLPAVIVIHEWWGLNDNVRAMADRLASEGYIVLAVDLYAGKTATNAEVARHMMLSVVENTKAATQNIRKAYQFVSETAGAPRIGSLGWCFGGGWSLTTAMLFPDDLDATVIYYGRVTDDEEKLRPINVPILGLFGADDKGISVRSVQLFEEALERLRKTYEIHIYPGAGHAFANPSGKNYNPEIAEDAWTRTLEFLGHNLVVETEDS